ncbi:MAG: DNA polymerase III subunit epsilon [Buchnera aphidicola (Meitanaphis microgallis)]
MTYKKIQKNRRKIILDTETTGMNFTGRFYDTHRIIEIGAVEVIGNYITGNNFHSYIYPDRLVDDSAFKIHGISDDFLLGQPKFFEIAEKFLKYLNNSDLVIHNAKFDVGFIDYELSMLSNLSIKNISEYCNIIDTLTMARKIFPGKKNTLDALCSRYKISTSHRRVHSAIYDAKLLAKVYIFMTNFQEPLPFLDNNTARDPCKNGFSSFKYVQSKTMLATNYENTIHKKFLRDMIEKSGKCMWITK